MRRSWLLPLGLVCVWLLSWGSLSVANVVSGVLVTLVIVAVSPVALPPRVHRLRPLAVARLAVHVAGQFLRSNWEMSRQILSPRPSLRTGVIAFPVQTRSDRVVTFIANVLALAPGTLPLDVQGDPSVIYVHVLHHDDVEPVRREIARLEALTRAALGLPPLDVEADAGDGDGDVDGDGAGDDAKAGDGAGPAGATGAAP
ncbi:MAG: Na+/H+ antiporter subunit E [Acidimicrobiia bacterium]